MFEPVFKPVFENVFKPLFDGDINTLSNGLIEYWKMQESSGARVGSVQGISLNDVNTVASGTGIIGNAGDFVAANNESLVTSGADKSNFSFPNQSYSIGFWMNADSNSASVLLSKFGVVGQRQYEIQIAPTLIRFNHVDASQAIKSVNRGGAVNTGQWYFIVAVYDHDQQKAILYVDNETPTELSVTTGSATVDTAELYIGSQNGLALWFDGKIDQVFFYNRALLPSEVQQHYNGGLALDWPFN